MADQQDLPDEDPQSTPPPGPRRAHPSPRRRPPNRPEPSHARPNHRWPSRPAREERATTGEDATGQGREKDTGQEDACQGCEESRPREEGAGQEGTCEEGSRQEGATAAPEAGGHQRRPQPRRRRKPRPRQKPRSPRRATRYRDRRRCRSSDPNRRGCRSLRPSRPACWPSWWCCSSAAALTKAESSRPIASIDG